MRRRVHHRRHHRENQIGQAWQALHDPKNRVVVQIAPAVRVALGEEFGLPAGATLWISW